MPVSILLRKVCAVLKYKHKAVDEFELIQKYFVGSGEVAGVSTGIGDDGAVLQPDPGKELIAVMDTLVEGTHFPDASDPFDIGYRVVAVNLSDVAAMGGRPRWMTLALTLPRADEPWIARFAAGLHAAAGEHDLTLVGGDTTSGKILVVSVQIIADIDAGKAIKRSGAQPGDHIYVTGTVGDAAAGLELILAGRPQDFLSARFLRPQARVEFGQALAGVATAAIDVSDGLFADLGKLLTASKLGGVLEIDALPLSSALRASYELEAQRRFALSGGDDYELCFTVAPGTTLPAGGIAVTRIGTVTSGDQLICHQDGELVPYADSGYLHFQ
jgi:thiamine-monophosphate kinase